MYDAQLEFTSDVQPGETKFIVSRSTVRMRAHHFVANDCARSLVVESFEASPDDGHTCEILTLGGIGLSLFCEPKPRPALIAPLLIEPGHVVGLAVSNQTDETLSLDAVLFGELLEPQSVPGG